MLDRMFDALEQPNAGGGIKGLDGIAGLGYDWYRRELLPAARTFFKYARTKTDCQLGAECATAIGDFVYCQLDSCRVAMHFHEEAVRLSPRRAILWHNLGDTYEQLGRRTQALDAYRKALQIYGTNDQCAENIKRLESKRSNVRDKVSDRNVNSFGWVDDLIAWGRPQHALDMLNNETRKGMRTARLHALAALGHHDELITTLDEINEHRENAKLRSSFWYLLPARTFDSPKFWELLHCGIDHIDAAWMPHPDGIDHWLDVKCGDRPGPMSADDWGHDRWRYNVEYHLARTQNDIDALKRIAAEAPGFIEAVEIVAELGRVTG